MKSNDYNQSQEQSLKKRNKGRIFLFLIFGLITIFLLSFSATSFILINSYRLTFAGENLALLQQELNFLKSELSRKDTEIEQLKLQLANIEGETSFVNQMR